MIETRGPTDFFCSRTIQTEVMKNNKSLVLKLNQRSYFKCQDFIRSSCEQLSWFEPSVCDVCLCFWREDHLSVWKLHEQQQARGSVRLPPAEFRSGEYKRVSTFLCNPSSVCLVSDWFFCSLSEAAGHQIYGPEADAAALHRQHHPGEISRGPVLPRRAALPGQSGAGWAHEQWWCWGAAAADWSCTVSSSSSSSSASDF